MSKSCQTCWRGPEPRRDVSACIRCFADPSLPLYIEHEECLPDADEALIDIIGNDGLHYLDPNVEPTFAKDAWKSAKRAPDCSHCANRGRIDGLSQETICDHCIYQERWRENH